MSNSGAVELGPRETLRAAIDRIIPADDFPSASENGVLGFLDRLFARDLAGERERFAAGVTQLDDEAKARGDGDAFTSLSTDRQDVMLSNVEAGRVRSDWPTPPAAWFALLVRLTNEGYYSDPGNGGNPDGASWRMVGFDPRRPAVESNEFAKTRDL